MYEISRAVMGDSHLATQLAHDPTRFIPTIWQYPDLTGDRRILRWSWWKDLAGGVCVILTEGEGDLLGFCAGV